MRSSSVRRWFAQQGGVGQPGYMKKFFKESYFIQNKQKKHSMHQYLIKLDQRNMRSPYRHLLAVPSKVLAMLVANQFNRQQKYLKPGEMPMLSLCRTAVDADIEGHLSQDLKHSIYEYLKTDSMLFRDQNYEDLHNKMIVPLLKDFNQKFEMNVKPSDSIQPPQFKITKNFHEWVDGLNNWQLIGIETMTIWLKSTIGASSIANHKKPVKMTRMATTLQEQIQMEQNGEVEQKIMDFNHIQLMVNCGQIMFRYGKLDNV